MRPCHSGRSTTKALTVSPRYASLAPMMQASWTAGCWYSSASTSAGQTLKPDGVDHALEAVDHEEVAVLVDAAEVAGAEEALAVELDEGMRRVASGLFQ